MSELEATGSRGQTAAPISRLSHSKLRSLASRGLGNDDDDVSLDAFAEVFAAIAASGNETKTSLNTEPESSIETDQVDRTGLDEDRDSGDQVESNESVSDDVDVDADVGFSVDESIITDDSGDANGLEGNDLAAALEDRPQDETGLGDEDVVVAAVATESDSSEFDLSDASPEAIEDLRRRSKKRSDQTVDDGPTLEGPDISQGRETKEAGPATDTNRSATDADGIHLPQGEASGGDDQPRRRSRRDRKDKTQAVDNAPNRSASQKPAEQTRGEFQLEGVAPAPVEREQANSSGPPPVVRKAAIAAVTGAPAQSITQQAATPNAPLARAGGNEAVGAIEPSSAPKPEAKEKASRGKGTSDSTTEAVNRAKLIQRVTKAFQHLGPDGGVVRLRLAPAELGTVRVEMRIQGRNMNARVVAETEAASNALREHLPDLRSRLESFGMQIERIEVETEADQGQSRFDGNFGDEPQQGWGRQGNRSPSPRTRNAPVSRAPIEPAPVSSQVASHVTSGVDLQL